MREKILLDAGWRFHLGDIEETEILDKGPVYMQAKTREKRTNRALLMLSLLSFFSALADSFGFTESFFGLFLGALGVKIIQGVLIAGIIAALIYVIYMLHSNQD